MSQTRSKEQVLMLPFMAQGHIIPFLALAKLLEQKTSYTISFISTPLNIQNLKKLLPPNTTIRLTPLPFNSSHHGLPSNTENTDSTPPHLLLPLIQASQSLQPSFDHLVADICRTPSPSPPPLCIISDAFMSWSVETAKKFGVFHCIFNTMGAYATSIFMSLWTHFPQKKIDTDDEFSLPDCPNTYLHCSQLSDVCRAANGSDPWSVTFQKHIFFWKQTQVMLVNTVEEMEEKALKQVQKNLSGVFAIGPVLPPPRLPFSSSTPQPCTDWLNRHPPTTVLYISFGSQSSIHPTQMMELAKGLEASGKPFIWVVRPPIGFDAGEEFRASWLPEGFEERMGERKQGLLVKKWAPQLEILSHASTGAFLSHCGWNSTLESLSRGVPIIGWPVSGEQFFNSKLLEEEVGAGVEMARGSDAEIGGVDVARMIGLVMDGESKKGRELRKKAKEMKEMMKDATEDGGSSIMAIEAFLQAAVRWRENSQFGSPADHHLFQRSDGDVCT